MLKWLGIELEGFGSEGAVLNLLINLLVIGMILYFFKIRPAMMKRNGKDRRKPMKPNNPNDKPGKAKECIQAGKDLVKVETKMDGFITQFAEFRIGVSSKFEEVFRQLRNRR